MAQLLTLYFEGNTLHSYDGTTYAQTNVDKTLVSVSKPYADALTWATNTAAALLAPHNNYAILADNHDDTIVNVAAGDFKGFHDPSGAGFMTLLQGAINKYVSDNAGTKKAFKLSPGRMRYFCPVCQNVHLAPHSSAVGGGSTPQMEFHEDVGGVLTIHRYPQNKAILYSMHKHLTTAYA